MHRCWNWSIGGLAMAMLIAVCCLAVPAGAIEPDEILKNAALEARARAISAGLRCPVCQNQSIDDSNAPLARDLRILVRERLVAGDSDAAVMRFLVARYGEFVLLEPPLNPATLLLWGTPLLLLCATGAVLALRLRRSAATAAAPEPPLTADEEARLSAVLGKPPEGGGARLS